MPPKLSLPSPFPYPFPFHSPIFGGLANILGACAPGSDVEPPLYHPVLKVEDLSPRSDAYANDDLIRILACPVATVRCRRRIF